MYIYLYIILTINYLCYLLITILLRYIILIDNFNAIINIINNNNNINNKSLKMHNFKHFSYLFY